MVGNLALILTHKVAPVCFFLKLLQPVVIRVEDSNRIALSCGLVCMLSEFNG